MFNTDVAEHSVSACEKHEKNLFIFVII